MLVHTRKRLTNTRRRAKIVKESSLEKELQDKPLSFDEAIKELLRGLPQGSVALRGFRNRENLTQNALGVLLGIQQTNISKMERGERPIGKETAKKLAKLFETDYRIFL